LGNEECIAARFGQRAGDRTDAAAIGVGIDHGGAFGLRALGQCLVIRGEIGQIYLQDPASFCFGRALDRDAGGKSLVVDEETAAFVVDFAVDRAFDDDIGAGLDGQATKKIAAHMKRAISLHDRVAEHRAMDFRRTADQQRSAFGALLRTRCNCRQQHWAPPARNWTDSRAIPAGPQA